MDQSVGGGVVVKWSAPSDRACDPRAPLLAVDGSVGVGIDEAEGDLGLGAPERDAYRSVPVIEDAHGSGGSARRLDDVAPVDPGVSVGPALGALGGDDGGHVGRY